MACRSYRDGPGVQLLFDMGCACLVYLKQCMMWPVDLTGVAGWCVAVVWRHLHNSASSPAAKAHIRKVMLKILLFMFITLNLCLTYPLLAALIKAYPGSSWWLTLCFPLVSDHPATIKWPLPPGVACDLDTAFGR